MAQPTKQSPSSSLLTIAWVKNETGKPPLIREYLEGTSEQFLKGDLVIMDRSEDGVVALGNSSGVPSARTFLGIAMVDASNVTSGFKGIPVLIPQAGDVFSAGLASAEGTAVVPDEDDRGKAYGLIKTTSGYDAKLPFVVDNANTDWVKVIDLHPQDVQRLGGQFPDSIPTMDAASRVLFQFLSAVVGVDGSQG